MKEQHYRIIGKICFIGFIAVGLYWCLNNKGLAGWLIQISENITGQRLGLISWILTLLILGIPGYMLKNYFEALAWNAHVESLPPPDRRDSAKRSKYVKAEDAPLAPSKPVLLTNVPKGQQEFIATCPACEKLFPAQRDQADLKCPQCGEKIPTS